MAVHSTCSASSERGGKREAKAPVSGYCGGWHGDYGRECHKARQQHTCQQEHALYKSTPVHYTSLQRSSCMPQQLPHLFSRLHPRLFFGFPTRLHSVHGRHGGLRPRINGALQEEGNENDQSLNKKDSEQWQDDSALPKQFRFGNTSDNVPFACFHGFRWIRHGFVVFSDLRPEKIGQKALVFSHFFTFDLYQASYSLMRLSATNTTSLSHPRCRYLAMGAWLFSLFCGQLLRDSYTVSLIGLIGLSEPWRTHFLLAL